MVGTTAETLRHCPRPSMPGGAPELIYYVAKAIYSHMQMVHGSRASQLDSLSTNGTRGMLAVTQLALLLNALHTRCMQRDRVCPYHRHIPCRHSITDKAVRPRRACLQPTCAGGTIQAVLPAVMPSINCVLTVRQCC